MLLPAKTSQVPKPQTLPKYQSWVLKRLCQSEVMFKGFKELDEWLSPTPPMYPSGPRTIDALACQASKQACHHCYQFGSARQALGGLEERCLSFSRTVPWNCEEYLSGIFFFFFTTFTYSAIAVLGYIKWSAGREFPSWLHGDKSD